MHAGNSDLDGESLGILQEGGHVFRQPQGHVLAAHLQDGCQEGGEGVFAHGKALLRVLLQVKEDTEQLLQNWKQENALLVQHVTAPVSMYSGEHRCLATRLHLPCRCGKL